MDSVRFGRALGIGARAAAKTLVTAVDAATSPNPSAAPKAQPAPVAAPSPAPTAATPSARVAQKTAQTVTQVRETGEGLKRGGKRFRDAVWGPTVKLSGILWLEFTGVFFGIFALFAGGGAWKLRGEMHRTATNHDANAHFFIAAAMAVVFAYFCISSFLTAHRRGRRR